MKLKKAMRGVPNGAIYPVDYDKGDDCPDELVDAARELGCLDARGGGSKQKGKGNAADDATEPPQTDVEKSETEPLPEPEVPPEADAPQDAE